MSHGHLTSLKSVARQSEASSGVRINALDGVRGIAAILVVLFHSSLIEPRFHDWYFAPPATGVDFAMFLVPLSLGPEAVYVFFVLSGFVLSHAYTAKSAATPSYLFSRIIRLYVPIWGAVALGVGVQILIGNLDGVAGTGWVEEQRVDLSMQMIVRDLVLLDGTSNINGSLWSMRYEVFFSLLLPIVILIAVPARRIGYRLGLIAVMAVVMFAVSDSLTFYMVMFLAGAVLAQVRIPNIPTLLAVPIFVIAVILFMSRRTFPLFLGQPAPPEIWIWFTAVTMAAVLFIMIAIGNKPISRLMSSRVMQFVGVRSYSLYLVQAPIIVATALILSPIIDRDASLPWVTFIAVSASFAVMMIFYKYVEYPSHLWSRTVKKFLAAPKMDPTSPDAISTSSREKSPQ
jgi:peptidoglycan/LPS O-acetylase OafA/YrhL